MLQEVISYTIHCDKCKVQFVESGTEFSIFGDAVQAKESAMDDGWHILLNKHLCPKCKSGRK